MVFIFPSFRFEEKGGKIKKQFVKNLQEVSLCFVLFSFFQIVNCKIKIKMKINKLNPRGGGVFHNCTPGVSFIFFTQMNF